MVESQINLAGARTLSKMCGAIASVIAIACLIGAIATPIVGIPRSSEAMREADEFLAESRKISKSAPKSQAATVESATGFVCCAFGAIYAAAGFAGYLGTIALTLILIGLGFVYTQAALGFLGQRPGALRWARGSCVTSGLIIATNIGFHVLASGQIFGPTEETLATAAQVGPFVNVAIHAFYMGMVVYTQTRPGLRALLAAPVPPA